MRIGNRNVILNTRLIVPADETAELDLLVEGQTIPIEVSFSSQPSTTDEPVSWSFNGGKLRMQFKGFPPGASAVVLRKPVRIGMVNTTKFGFTFSLAKISGSHLLDLIFMAGGTYDE